MSTTYLDDVRGRALHFLQSGMLTQTEAAELAGVTRQRIHQWAQAAGIQPVRARKQHLRDLWRTYGGDSR